MNRLWFSLLFAVALMGQGVLASSNNYKMHQAAQVGDLNAVHDLLGLVDETGINWAVECAAGNGHDALLKTILTSDKRNVSPNQQGMNISVMRAAGFGDLEMVQYLTQHLLKDVPLPSQVGINWAIAEGARAGHFDIVRYLVEHYYKNVPHPDQDGINNAAIQAALEGHLNIFHYLSTHEQDDVPYPDESTRLELEEERGDNEHVDILLDLFREEEQRTPSNFQDV